MTLATLFQTSNASPARGNKTRRIRHSSCSRRSTTKPQLEWLEVRLALSGFGPEDGSYIVEPWIGSYTDIKIQSTDQKIVAAGTFPGPGVAIARYDSVGNRDTSYGSGGITTTTIGYAGTTAGLALQPDGKAIVASKKASTGYFGAARFNTNGSLDGGFGNGGWSGVNVVPTGFTAVPMGVGLQSTGKIVVGGIAVESLQNPTAHSAVLARFTTSGATDNGKGGFGNVVSGKATGYVKETFGATIVSFDAVAIQQDDKVVAVGDFSPTRSASGQLIVARYTAAGVRDTTFNGSGYSVLNLPGINNTSVNGGHGVAMQSDGKIVVVSTASGIDGSSDVLVVRFNSNGSLDTSFGGGVGYVRLDIDGTVSQSIETGYDVTIQPDGKIVAIGQEVIWSATPGQPTNVLVARLNPNGTPDLTFGSGGFKIGAPPTGAEYHSFRAAGVALQTDGSIIVAGIDYQSSGGNERPLLMRFFGTNSALAPTVTSSASSVGAATDTALTLLQNEDLTSTHLKKTSSTAVQIGTTANTSFIGGNGTPTVTALTNVANLVQKSNSSKSRLGKISSSDLVLSLDDWFGSLGQ